MDISRGIGSSDDLSMYSSFGSNFNPSSIAWFCCCTSRECGADAVTLLDYQRVIGEIGSSWRRSRVD